MKILKSSDYQTSIWTGGTTTQLYIFPENEMFADKTFLFRISSAKIEMEHSDFSQFTDYKRLILTLDRTIRLRHNGGIEMELNPLQIHNFDGNWVTSSEGKCRDFNLIFRPELSGNIEVIHLKKNKKYLFCRAQDEQFRLTFLYKGILNSDDILVAEEESIILKEDDKENYEFVAVEDSILISVHISS